MKRQAQSPLPTKWGMFIMIAYARQAKDSMPHLAMVNPTTDFTKTVNVRLHSECITGDLFGSKRCDCGEQLHYSLQKIAEEGGVVLYLRQEGRGIGIINKLKAYNLQDTGINTADANLHLGFDIDERDYGIAIAMLKDLGITSINLLTNNPDKLKAFDNSGIKIEQRLPIRIPPQKENLSYLQTKKNLMGHFL